MKPANQPFPNGNEPPSSLRDLFVQAAALRNQSAHLRRTSAALRHRARTLCENIRAAATPKMNGRPAGWPRAGAPDID